MSQKYELHYANVDRLKTNYRVDETWKRTAMIAHRLDVFRRRCLRTILVISCRNHATNEEVMRKACMERLRYIVTARRRKMAGQVIRLHRERPIQRCTGRQNTVGERGRQKKTHEELFKEYLEEMVVSWYGARRIASAHEIWRLLVTRFYLRNMRT